VSIAAIVLAAGRGTRFRSERPKVLHAAAGRSLVAHVLHALAPLDCQRLVVVVGHGADDVTAEVATCAERLGRAIEVVDQPEQLGTGDATAIALSALASSGPTVDRVLVVPGDTPLVRASTFADLVAASAGIDVAMLSAHVEDPTGYGRVLRDTAGAVTGIVEHRDADERERAVSEINAGMYVADRESLARALEGVDDRNDQGERYLTDAITALVGGGATVVAIAASADEVAGVNDRAQLATAGAVLRHRHLDHLMREVGVTVIDPSTTYVDVDVTVGPDTVLFPGTVLDGATTIGAGCVIGPNSHLTACEVGERAQVHSSRADAATIGDEVSVGPFAHLRPGTRLGRRSRVGAFVETKNATIGADSKVPHLSYVGDAVVGDGANIACGVVTANYDGHTKHVTTIGDGAFVGCGVMLVAPVTVGDGAYVAAGSTITKDVPPDALGVGRARQENREGWAARRRAARQRVTVVGEDG